MSCIASTDAVLLASCSQARNQAFLGELPVRPAPAGPGPGSSQASSSLGVPHHPPLVPRRTAPASCARAAPGRRRSGTSRAAPTAAAVQLAQLCEPRIQAHAAVAAPGLRRDPPRRSSDKRSDTGRARARASAARTPTASPVAREARVRFSHPMRFIRNQHEHCGRIVPLEPFLKQHRVTVYGTGGLANANNDSSGGDLDDAGSGRMQRRWRRRQ